jgi:hypothetical protein
VTEPIRRRLSAWLLAAARGRMRRTHADWAEAMLAEAEICTSEADRLSWAWGCWTASLRASCSVGAVVRHAALPTGLGVMTAYEWSADEGPATVVVLAVVAMLLGALRPRRALLSGAFVGAVVTGVIAFEALSGIRPAYEVRTQTLAHSLHWMILLAPALASAAVGGRIGRRLHPVRPPP